MIIKGKDVRLPKRFKAKWLKALRSGDYKQGRWSLYNSSFDAYCCIGIAGLVCNVNKNKMNGKYIFTNSDFKKSFLSKLTLPKVLIGTTLKGDENFSPILYKLVNMNDSGKHSFKSIAAYIERYL